MIDDLERLSPGSVVGATINIGAKGARTTDIDLLLRGGIAISYINGTTAVRTVVQSIDNYAAAGFAGRTIVYVPVWNGLKRTKGKLEQIERLRPGVKVLTNLDELIGNIR